MSIIQRLTAKFVIDNKGQPRMIYEAGFCYKVGKDKYSEYDYNIEYKDIDGNYYTRGQILPSMYCYRTDLNVQSFKTIIKDRRKLPPFKLNVNKKHSYERWISYYNIKSKYNIYNAFKSLDEYKYLLSKCKNRSYSMYQEHVFNLMIYYHKYPEMRSLIELAVTQNWYHLCLYKSFYKHSRDYYKKIVQYAQKNKIMSGYNPAEIMFEINTGVKYYYRYNVIPKNIRMKVIEYLKKKNINNVNTYCDYFEQLKEYKPESLNDDYWLYPKDLYKQHQLLIKEIEIIKKKQLQEENKQRNLKYKSLYNKWNMFKCKIDDYMIDLPKSQNNMNIHAKTLHQCLVANNYDDRYLKENIILLFVYKDNESYGTIELDTDYNIIQAYANELDRNDCHINTQLYEKIKNYIERTKENVLYNNSIQTTSRI